MIDGDYFKKFKDSHQTSSSTPCYLYPKKNDINSQESRNITYEIRNTLPEFISQYANHRLIELNDALISNSAAVDKTTLLETAQLIYGDYKKGYSQQPWLERAFHVLLIFVGIHEPDSRIEQIYQSIQFQNDPVLLGSSQKIDLGELERRQKIHRKPNAGDYGDVALSRGPYQTHLKNALANPNINDKLKVASPEHRAIMIAKIKEEACRHAYENDLPKNIEKGYYDPAIIPYDIEKLLGPVENCNIPISNIKNLNELLKKEIQKYAEGDKLNSHQAHHLSHDAISIAKRYLKAYPGKSYRDAFFLTRDLIRIATYQEFYDKSSFNGSDHGSKHIHHNILNALALHKNMRKGRDYNTKDKFMEQLIHFYHDIGYSVGLATTDFDCCKDHPLIGAKMIDENRNYFVHYLDEVSFETLRDCILFHAIVNPDLTAREEVNGLHPGMVRAVTSISDACAVTYDRKTQEFWEQPRALVALARLKTFLVLYPEYKTKLGDDIVKGPWPDYDEKIPSDKMAYDIFLNTVKELNGMVDEYDIADEKKNLFRQAIKQQFNAFKANVTLGQYGAVLAKVEAIENPNKTEDEQPSYIPQFTLAPSIMYGVLKDLFGNDQANDAFKKLVEEFNGDMKVFEKELNEVTSKQKKGGKVVTRHIRTGNAFFKLLGRFDHDVKDKHMSQLQTNLKTSMIQIQSAFKMQKASIAERQQVMKAFDAWRVSSKEEAFAFFIQEHLLPLLDLTDENNEQLTLISKFASANQTNLAEPDFARLKSAIRILMISDEEYKFMRGEEAIPKNEIFSNLFTSFL
jgi:hypothetical protein